MQRGALAGLAFLTALGGAVAHAEERPWRANQTEIRQEGPRNGAAAFQRGLRNAAAIAQRGAENYGQVTQNGQGNAATVRQIGRSNGATVSQSGDDNTACVVQVGRGLQTSVTQTGGQTGGVLQTPAGSKPISPDGCSAMTLSGALIRWVKAR